MTTATPDGATEPHGGVASTLRGFGVLAVASVVGQALGFGALTIVTRRVGAPALGNYNFALSLSMYFGLLANPGIGYVAMRDISLDRKRVSRVVSESLTLQAILSTIAYVLLVALAPALASNGQARGLIPIVGLSLLVFSLDSILLALGSRVPLAIARVVGQVVYAALVPVLVTTHSGPAPYAWLNILGLAVTAVIVAFALWRMRALRYVRPRVRALWARLRQSTAIGYSVTMIQLYNRADILLLGYLATPREVGLYAVANRLPYSLVTLANVWIQASFSRATTMIRDQPERFRLELSRTLTATAVFALAITCGAALFPGRIMAALFGGGFTGAGPPFAILAAAMALVPIEAVLSTVVIAGARDRRYAQIVTVGAVVNIGLNFALIPSLKASGSAIATLVTEALLIVLTLIAARSIVGLPSLELRRLGRGAAAVALMCGAMLAANTISVWLALLAGPVVLLASCVLLRVFGGVRDR